MQAVLGCARGTADNHAVDLEAQEGGEQVAGGSLLCVPGSRGLGSAPLSVNSLFPWASWGFRSLPHSSWPLQKKRQLGGVGALRHGCRVDHVHAARGGRRARWGQKFSLLGASGRNRPIARSRVLPRGFRAVVLSPTGRRAGAVGRVSSAWFGSGCDPSVASGSSAHGVCWTFLLSPFSCVRRHTRSHFLR